MLFIFIKNTYLRAIR